MLSQGAPPHYKGRWGSEKPEDTPKALSSLPPEAAALSLSVRGGAAGFHCQAAVPLLWQRRGKRATDWRLKTRIMAAGLHSRVVRGHWRGGVSCAAGARASKQGIPLMNAGVPSSSQLKICLSFLQERRQGDASKTCTRPSGAAFWGPGLDVAFPGRAQPLHHCPCRLPQPLPFPHPAWLNSAWLN